MIDAELSMTAPVTSSIFCGDLITVSKLHSITDHSATDCPLLGRESFE